MCLASLCVSIHSVLQFETNHLITYVLCISFHTAHSACLSSYMVSLHTATYSTKWPLTVWTKLSRHSFWRRKHNLFKQIKILLGPGLNFINFTVDISTWNHKMSKYIYKNETYILLDILWPHHWGESGGHDVVVGARGISQTNDLKHGVRCPEAEARKSDECADTWVMVTRSADVTRHRTRHAPSPEHQGHFLRACWQNRLLPDRTTRRSGTTMNVTVVGTCPCYFRKGWQFFVAKICFLTTRLIYRMRRKGIGCINLSYEKKGHPLSTCFLTLGIFFTSLFDLINNSLLKKGKKNPGSDPNGPSDLNGLLWSAQQVDQYVATSTDQSMWEQQNFIGPNPALALPTHTSHRHPSQDSKSRRRVEIDLTGDRSVACVGGPMRERLT